MKTLTQKRIKRITKRITKKKVWEVFSKYIRLKYADKDGYVICYTCSRKLRWQESQAGHAIGGRSNSVIFDEDLVKPQCVRCNIFLRGNYTIFTTRLIKEKGMKWWEKKLFNSKKVKKFTQLEFQEFYEHYKNEIEKLMEVKGKNE